MSLNESEIVEHCKYILGSRKIQDRLVILCEGSIVYPGERPSPQTYKRMEKMPDANFYRKCVPKGWREKIPHFFNCGDRVDVLKVYSTLISLNDKNPMGSYLNSEKLFGIIDLDIQSQSLFACSKSQDTEELYKELYTEGNLNLDKVSNHRIWVTGLIHKEAYFLMPFLQQVFDDFPVELLYKGTSLRLERIYVDMLNDLDQDNDLKSHFSDVFHRISHCFQADDICFEECCIQLGKSDLNSSLLRTYESYVKALLTIRKAKPYWLSIFSEESSKDIRDQLRLAIATFFSESESLASEIHIPGFIKFLSSLK